MKILFIGGTGIISSACTKLAAERGNDLTLLNRGETRSKRPIPDSVHELNLDYSDTESVTSALKGKEFDVVVNWITFTPDQIERDIELFRNRVGQFIFISSASAYQTPPASLPVTESTILDNPYWEYSRNKIACEQRLVQAYRNEKFPITIVRPSHTYDHTSFPFSGGYTNVDRMRCNKPVIVYGDGTSLWTLTHNIDFAKAFVGLLGNNHTIGEAFHITSDEWLTWNQIFQLVANAAGVMEPNLVHVPSEIIASFDPDWGAGLLGDKSHSMIFDNSKIKRVVPDFKAEIPYSIGVREIIAWHDEDPNRKTINPEFDKMIEKILQNYPRPLLGVQ